MKVDQRYSRLELNLSKFSHDGWNMSWASAGAGTWGPITNIAASTSTNQNSFAMDGTFLGHVQAKGQSEIKAPQA